MANFKRFIVRSTIFFFGFIVGVVATIHLEKKVRPTFVRVIQSGLKVEQEFLAAKAARENRLFESAVHRWVAVNAESKEGFKIFQENQNYYNAESVFFPFQLLVIETMYSPDNVKKGEKIVEGIDRGKLAVSLEMAGEKDMAEIQWEQAKLLMQNRSIETIRKTVYNMLKQEETDLHLKAETVVLGERNKSPNHSVKRTGRQQ